LGSWGSSDEEPRSSDHNYSTFQERNVHELEKNLEDWPLLRRRGNTTYSYIAIILVLIIIIVRDVQRRSSMGKRVVSNV